MAEEILYDETQYSGYNKYSLVFRIALAVFCFVNYHLNEGDKTADLFYYMGIIILVVSGILIFVPHLKTKVVNGKLILDGLWSSRKITLDLKNFVSCKKVKYSKYLLNKAVYNLHRRKKNKVKFFTRGTEAVELVTKEGKTYLIGTQRVNELNYIINAELARINNNK